METTPNVTSASNGGMIGGLNAAKMGRDEFLKLLVTQLQHQDPLSPMEVKILLLNLRNLVNSNN